MNPPSAKFVVFRSRSPLRSRRYGWRLVSYTGRIIASGGEQYSNRAEAERMGRRVVSGVYSSAVEGGSK